MFDKTYAMCKLCTPEPPTPTCGLQPYAQAQLFTMWRHCYGRKTIIQTTEATANEYRRKLNVCTKPDRCTGIRLFNTIACNTSIHLSSVRRPLYSQYFHANYTIKSKPKFLLLVVSFIVIKNLMGFNAICTGILLTTFRWQLAASIFRVHEARRGRQNTHPPHTASYPRILYSSTKYKCFWSLSTWPASPVTILLHSPNCTSPYPISEEKKK